MNLFKKIWTKNFLKGNESLDKLSEDMGGLEGHFTWQKIKDGRIIDTCSFHNDITNLSRSTAIRLLAQGVNSYRDASKNIDPTKYKISRMRFGNAPYTDWNGVEDKILAYYNPNEVSSRHNLTSYVSGAVPYASAGGKIDDSKIPANIGSIKDKTTNMKNVSDYTWTAGSTIEIPITNPNDTPWYPPSHRTLRLVFYRIDEVEVASISFDSIYSRTQTNNGNIATSVASGNDLLSNILTDHYLVYVPSEKKWKVVFKLGGKRDPLPGEISIIAKFSINFEIGKNNVINSIVPRFGENVGNGGETTRFPSGPSYYSIGTPIFSNSDAGAFVDDYAVTFSVTMNTTEGNGTNNTTARPVFYTEAFLLNEMDDLFSIVRFPYPNSGGGPTGFSKDPSVAYLISWQIKTIV